MCMLRIYDIKIHKLCFNVAGQLVERMVGGKQDRSVEGHRRLLRKEGKL